MKETKDYWLQLSGDEMEAALPEDTPMHRRMKDVFMRQCTSCHGANIAFQNKFDEQGWEAIINAMSRTNTSGGFHPDGPETESGHDLFQERSGRISG